MRGASDSHARSTWRPARYSTWTYGQRRLPLRHPPPSQRVLARQPRRIPRALPGAPWDSSRWAPRLRWPRRPRTWASVRSTLAMSSWTRERRAGLLMIGQHRCAPGRTSHGRVRASWPRQRAYWSSRFRTRTTPTVPEIDGKQGCLGRRGSSAAFQLMRRPGNKGTGSDGYGIGGLSLPSPSWGRRRTRHSRGNEVPAYFCFDLSLRRYLRAMPEARAAWATFPPCSSSTRAT